MTSNFDNAEQAPRGIFVTGTDTEIGKTYVTSLVIRSLVKKAKKVAGMKPIASGFEQIDGVWRNEDVDAIKLASNVEIPDKLINRYSFRQAIAPHIACANSDKEINLDLIKDDFRQCAKQADLVIVEGVGGWRVPLTYADPLTLENKTETVADLAKLLGLPVILVVGMRLGCINHALLTAQAIQSDGLNLLGWVANCVDPAMPELESNIKTIEHLLAAPLIAKVPYGADLNDPSLCSQFAISIDELG